MAEKETNTTTEETVEEQENLSEVYALKLELEKSKAQADDFKDRWMRNVAEFDNYKKRNATLYANAFFEGKVEVLLKVLPIGDNLDMAIAMGLD